MPMTLTPHRIRPERILWMRTRVFRESRSEFAKRIWCSGDTIKSWETGTRTPNGAALRWLCYWEKVAGIAAAEKEAVLSRALERNR